MIGKYEEKLKEEIKDIFENQFGNGKEPPRNALHQVSDTILLKIGYQVMIDDVIAGVYVAIAFLLTKSYCIF